MRKPVLPKIEIEGTRFKPEPAGPEGQCMRTQRANYERRMKAIAIAAHTEEMYKILRRLNPCDDVEWEAIDSIVNKVEDTYKGLTGK